MPQQAVRCADLPMATQHRSAGGWGARHRRRRGTRSAFQRELEGVHFSDDVKVRVFGGTADETAVMDNRWMAIARNISGQEPAGLDGATHDSAVGAAADKLR